MNLILHYWFLAPSLCIALATAYFTYRVLIGYVNTPEKAVKQAYGARAAYVLGRINKSNGICDCNSVGVRIGVLSPPCDYCKGLQTAAPKEVEANPLVVERLVLGQTAAPKEDDSFNLAASVTETVSVSNFPVTGTVSVNNLPNDKSCNIDGEWVFEKYRYDNTWRCKKGEDKGNVGRGYIDLDKIIAHFPKHKYTWDIQDMLNGEHLLTIRSRKDYFGAKNNINYC